MNMRFPGIWVLCPVLFSSAASGSSFVEIASQPEKPRSFIAVEASSVSARPSMVRRTETAVEDAGAHEGEKALLHPLTASILVLQDGQPAVSSEKVAAIPQRPRSHGTRSMPTVMRGGERGPANRIASGAPSPASSISHESPEEQAEPQQAATSQAIRPR